MELVEILADLFDRKTVDVLKCLLKKDKTFYLRDLSREANVSLATTYRIVQRLLAIGLVKKEIHEKFTFYSIVKNSPAYSELAFLILGKKKAVDPVALLKAGLAKYSDMELYALKGKEEKYFIVSEQAGPVEIETLISGIEDETGKRLNYMLINNLQFDQMKQLGLVSKDLKKL